MEERRARASAACDAVFALLLTDRVLVEGLRQVHGLFIVTNVPGTWMLSTTLERVDEALPQLEALVENVEAVPDAVRAWLTAAFKFGPVFLPDIDGVEGDWTRQRALAPYDCTEDVFIHVEVEYDVVKHDCYFKSLTMGDGAPLPGWQPMGSRYDSALSPMTQAFLDHDAQVLLDAGVTATDVGTLLQHGTADDKPMTNADVRRGAEQFLARDTCVVCEAETHLTCGACKMTKYCSIECQRRDWRERHKLTCPMMADVKRRLLRIASGEHRPSSVIVGRGRGRGRRGR